MTLGQDRVLDPDDGQIIRQGDPARDPARKSVEIMGLRFEFFVLRAWKAHFERKDRSVGVEIALPSRVSLTLSLKT
jgi:hypothetical protein